MGGTINVVGGRDISLFRPGVDSAPVPLLASSRVRRVCGGGLARWPLVAYQSNEAGREDVYLRPFPGVDARKAAGVHRRRDGSDLGAQRP